MPVITSINPPPGCPIGPMTAGATDRGVCLLTFSPTDACSERLGDLQARHAEPCVAGDHPLLDQLRHQLDAFFEGDIQAFTVPLDTPGTAWERRVWAELTTIPPGETRSYGQIARSLGNPGGSRAVGLANRRNPVAILIPCHRVVASDGSLHGYAGGLERKRWLLDHEQTARPTGESLFGSRQEQAF